jgi:hypothetical protein
MKGERKGEAGDEFLTRSLSAGAKTDHGAVHVDVRLPPHPPPPPSPHSTLLFSGALPTSLHVCGTQQGHLYTRAFQVPAHSVL